MSYYPRLKELRLQHELTQKQLSSLLHMLQPQYQRYEAGTRDIPTTVLIALADLYDVSVDYILGRTFHDEHTDLIFY